MRLAESPGFGVAASRERRYRCRSFFVVRTFFFRRAFAFCCCRIAAFVGRIHAAAAGQAGRDEIADVRDVGEVVGGTVEDGAADVARRIRPRLVRTLAGESGDLVAVRRGRDTGPGTADLRLVRTLAGEAGHLTARHLRDAVEAGFLEIQPSRGAGAAGEILLNLSLQKARGAAECGAALFDGRIALDPHQHRSGRLGVANRLGVEDGVVGDVDIARQLGVGVQPAVAFLAGIAEPAGQHARLGRILCVSDDASDEVSIVRGFVGHGSLLSICAAGHQRRGSPAPAARPAARFFRRLLHAFLGGVKSPMSR